MPFARANVPAAKTVVWAGLAWLTVIIAVLLEMASVFMASAVLALAFPSRISSEPLPIPDIALTGRRLLLFTTELSNNSLPPLKNMFVVFKAPLAPARENVPEFKVNKPA